MRHRFRAGPRHPAAGQPTNAGPWAGRRRLAALSWVASPPGVSTRIMLDEGRRGSVSLL
jgi:hypothetical protein